jgi:hypothetical protein
MDNVMWVVIAAAVVISLAGVVLYIGSTSLGDFEDSGDDIEDNYTEEWSPDNDNNQNEGNDDESDTEDTSLNPSLTSETIPRQYNF